MLHSRSFSTIRNARRADYKLKLELPWACAPKLLFCLLIALTTSGQESSQSNQLRTLPISELKSTTNR